VGLVLWCLCYGVCVVGLVLWGLCCGACVMGLVLWGLCCGVCVMGLCCGVCVMVRRLWVRAGRSELRAVQENIECNTVICADWQGVGATVLLSLHCCDSYCHTVAALL